MKKYITVLTIFVLTVMSVFGVCAKSDLLYGDATSDGVVSIMDATGIQMYLVRTTQLSDTARKCADVDGDGDITILDATLIQKYLAGYFDKFPAYDIIRPTAGLDDNGYNNEVVRP